jgi:hypothetical protein
MKDAAENPPCASHEHGGERFWGSQLQRDDVDEQVEHQRCVFELHRNLARNNLESISVSNCMAGRGPDHRPQQGSEQPLGGGMPIWMQTNMSLVLIFRCGKIVKTHEPERPRAEPAKGEGMKFKLVLPVVAVLLLTSIPGQAKKNTRLFFLSTTATLNGAEVPGGIYDLDWETHGSIVRVTLSKGGRFYATAQGEWVKSGAKFKDDAALLLVKPDGSRALVEIRLAGNKRAIVLGNTVETLQTPPGSSTQAKKAL